MANEVVYIYDLLDEGQHLLKLIYQLRNCSLSQVIIIIIIIKRQLISRRNMPEDITRARNNHRQIVHTHVHAPAAKQHNFSIILVLSQQ